VSLLSRAAATVPPERRAPAKWADDEGRTPRYLALATNNAVSQNARGTTSLVARCVLRTPRLE